MKYSRSFALLLSITWLLTSCGNLFKDGKAEKPELVSVTAKNSYTVVLPDYMKKSKELNDRASLQFQNVFKEVYVIVIDEPKQEFIDGFTAMDMYDSTMSAVENYHQVQMQNLEEGIQILERAEPKPMKIHGLDAVQVQLDGTVKDVDGEITYYITFIEGQETLYFMMAWTLRESKAEYGETLDAISRSFREKKKAG